MIELRNEVYINRPLEEVWPESFDQGRRAWRGKVVDTTTSARRYFARWEDLLEFFCDAIEVAWEGDVSLEITTVIVDNETDHEPNEWPQ